MLLLVISLFLLDAGRRLVQFFRRNAGMLSLSILLLGLREMQERNGLGRVFRLLLALRFVKLLQQKSGNRIHLEAFR